MVKGTLEPGKDRDEEGTPWVACGLRCFANGLVGWRVDGEDEMGELVDAPVGIRDGRKGLEEVCCG